jgi:hypothetical protein
MYYPNLEEFLKSNVLLFISVKKGKNEGLISNKVGERFFSFYTKEELIKLVEKIRFKIRYVEIIPDNKLIRMKSKGPDWMCLYVLNPKSKR